MGYSSRATSPEGDEVGVRRAASTSMAASPNFVGGNGMSEDPSLFFFSGDADETGFSSEDFGRTFRFDRYISKTQMFKNNRYICYWDEM